MINKNGSLKKSLKYPPPICIPPSVMNGSKFWGVWCLKILYWLEMKMAVLYKSAACSLQRLVPENKISRVALRDIWDFGGFSHTSTNWSLILSTHEILGEGTLKIPSLNLWSCCWSHVQHDRQDFRVQTSFPFCDGFDPSTPWPCFRKSHVLTLQ